jgi:hypothetical protein
LDQEKKSQVIKKRLIRIVARFFFTLFLLFFLLVGIISIPYVQTRIVNRLTQELEKITQHEIDIEYANLKWFDAITLKGVHIRDDQGKEMVSVGWLDVDYSLIDMFNPNTIFLDRVDLVRAKVHMIDNAPDSTFNFSHFIKSISEAYSSDKPRHKKKDFIIRKVSLLESAFSMNNTSRDSLNDRFDPNHFSIQNIDAELENFTLAHGIVRFTANQLSGIDTLNDLKLEKLQTTYEYTPKSMTFSNLDLIAGTSALEGSLIFTYNDQRDLRDFIKLVNIEANVKKSLINTTDLAKFAPNLKFRDKYFRLKGYVDGAISRFETKNLIFEFGASSWIEGNISMYGLPNIQETFIDARLEKARVNMYDLESIVSEKTFSQIDKFGIATFKGNFTGFITDFVSNASFSTEIGSFVTDINLKFNPDNQDASTYSGSLRTMGFDLGTFLGDTASVQKVDMSGKLSGRGFSVEKAEVNLEASIDKLGIKHYIYQNIRTNAKLAKELFEGILTIEDPNLKFTGSAEIDLREDIDIIRINARLDTAMLQELNLTPDYAFLSSNLDVNLEGLQIDKIFGKAILTNTHIEHKEKKYDLDSVEMISVKDTLSRSLMVNSSLMDMKLIGDFQLSRFAKDIITLAREYKLNIENNPEKLEEYYRNKVIDKYDFYYMDLYADVKDINPVLDLLYMDYRISPETEINGSFTGGYTSIIELNSEPEYLTIKDYQLVGNSISFSTSILADTAHIDANATLSTDQQFNRTNQQFENILLEVNWHEKLLQFLVSADKFQSENYMRLTGSLTLKEMESILKVNTSEFKVFDKIWRISEDNMVTIREKYFDIQNLILYHEDQSVSVNGIISDDPDDNLFCAIKNFDMETLNPIIKKSLGGKMNGYVDLIDMYNSQEINSDLNIRGFSLDDIDVGQVKLEALYDNDQKRFNLYFDVENNNKNVVKVNGYVQPQHKIQQLNLRAHFDHTRLKLLEPFIGQLFSDLEGTYLGIVDISGRFDKPGFNGDGEVENGQLVVNYLNTRYDINGDVNFNNDEIIFDNMSLTDAKGNDGRISGKISHKLFKDYTLDLKGSFKNFQLLNLSARQNELIYGEAYATGDMQIVGDMETINFYASAKTEKNTKIFIPLGGSSSVSQKEFIQFVSIDTTQEKQGSHQQFSFLRREDTKLNFLFDIEVTPDAYSELIFDITSGDIIRGRGNGKLTLDFDTEDKFNMYGDLNIQEGGYNFTMYNIINKEFNILPNSHITWTGDPYAADLDLKAIYRQLVSLSPILQISEESKSSPEAQRKYPSYVEMDITGDLMSPEIDFDIVIEEYAKNQIIDGISLESHVQAFYSRIQSDEQEMNRQVFSLIILRSFQQENAFNASGSVGNSVSEFVSNQLSYWVTQIDENLVVDVDLGNLDDEQFNTFQLRLSYSFLDGRLRVTHDNSYADQSRQNNVSSLIGDWSVEYMLTEDGKLRAKIYSKSNFNPTTNPTAIEGRNRITTGFSLMHTQSFDKWKDLFGKARKKAREEEKQKQTPDEEFPTGEKGITREPIPELPEDF